MATFNKITLVGYLGRDPELKYTPSGDAVCSFSVATTERRKVNGETVDETTWFRITAWRRQAEVAAKYLVKGSQVYVDGKLRMQEFTDRDGNKRTSLEVSASDLQFIGGKLAEAGDSDEAPRAKGTNVGGAGDPQSSKRTQTAPADGDDDDGVPF